VVVGGSPYQTEYSKSILGETDPRVRCLGPVYESAALNGLYQNAYAYIHGHEVGGTNPSLLRAMQAGAPCIGVDVVFTREVIGADGLFFSKEAGVLAGLLTSLDTEPARLRALGEAMHARAAAQYRWDAIAAAYASLFEALVAARRAGRRFDGAKGGEVYHPLDFPATVPTAAPAAAGL
jgi:glycosyltransferase involved in cell wall biosynthesis